MIQKKDIWMVGICGASASGKSWLINQLAKNFEENISIVSQDNYYNDNPNLTLSEREALNYDHPKSIDF